MANQSKLQRSEIVLEGTLATAVIVPADGRTSIRLQIGQGYGAEGETLTNYPLLPSDAYLLGGALQRHAIECGYDPDTGEDTRPLGSMDG